MARLPIDPTAGTLAGDGSPRAIPEVEARPGLLVEVASDAFVGAVVRCDPRTVVLRDRRERERSFSRSPGAFIVDERRVTLVPPPPPPPSPGRGPSHRRRGTAAATSPAPGPQVTNSGSVAVADVRPRVAQPSRILVEGVHDAALVEQVWGDDLRIEGIVVEVLHGADDLDAVVRAFAPGPDRRLGVLLDHLVDGTKETRIAASVRHPHVLVTGHAFVDIFTAVRPEVVGIDAWPQVPRGEDYKQGLADRLGLDGPQQLWHLIRDRVTTWRDLDRSLIHAVESLIDFVTEPTADRDERDERDEREHQGRPPSQETP
jgi:hypothetical protein